MEILKDTVGSLWFIQYALAMFSLAGLLFLLVAMRPDISYFSGRSRRLRARGKREKGTETGK